MHKKNNITLAKLISVTLIGILLLTTGFSAFSQTAVNDSINIKKPITEHSPRKATIYSAVLPGLGQIYNRKYWKVPIVVGGFATLGYFINYNNNVYATYKQAYSDLIDNDPNTNSFKNLNVNPIFFQDDKIAQFTERVRIAKDGWRRNRDLVIIGTAVFYALNIIDASVDANFFNFDISEDLTMNWAPEPIITKDNRLVGFHCIFTF